MEETEWIGKIKQGDTASFQPLYQKYHRTLYSLCYRFTNHPEDAEEQLQEIFMRVLSKIHQFEGTAKFGTWLYRLAVNHLINYRDRRAEMLPMPEDGEPVRYHPELKMAIGQAVRQLSPGFRQVFILHDQEGLRHDEIAEILGCSAATSRSPLARARVRLRELLKPVLTEVSP